MKKYFKYKIENLLNVNKIITVHYFEFGKNFCSEGESHDFWELVYCDKGDIFCIANGRQFTLKQGEVYFHQPGEFHVLKANGVKAPNVFIISFDCKSDYMQFFKEKLIKPEKSAANYVYTITEEARKVFDIPYSDPKVTKMNLRKNPELGSLQILKNVLEIFLIELMRTELKNANANTVFLDTEEYKKKFVKDLISYLKKNVNDRISVDDICDQTGYSRSYVFKEFKNATGKTLVEYFTNLKIEEAKKKLRQTDMSISEISESLSFDSPNYFSKTFKKITKTTPSAYKRITLNL